MRLLILGHYGQLGSELLDTFKNTHEVKGLDIHDIDITKQQVVNNICSQFRPHCIINAAAYTQVEAAESDALKAYKVNALGAYYIAQQANELNAIFVQISTDYVFGNTKSRYIETDYPCPLNVYGASKLAGEQLVKIACNRHYIIRTSALFGKQKSGQNPNFVEKMLTLSKRKLDISIVNDQFTSPTYVVDLAKAIYNLLEKKSPFGVYHITNKGSCSWYEFAKYILNAAGINVKVKPIQSSESPSVIVRPRSSILRSVHNNILPPWEDAIERYVKDVQGIK